MTVFRTALRTVLAHRARLLMTVLAVLLGVAFVAGTLVFTTSVSDAYVASSRQGLSGVDVRVRPVEEGRLLDEALRAKTAALPGVTGAAGAVEGFTALAGKDGRLVGDGWPTRGANPSGTRHRLTTGRMPAVEGEIALDSHTARRTGYAVGDTVRLSVSGPVLTPTVTGVFDTDDGNVAAGGTLVLFDTATAQRLLAEPGRYNQIDLAVGPGFDPDALKALLPYGVEAVTAAQLAERQAERNAESVTALSQVLLACAGVALFVGIFLIVNTFTMLVTQRTRELALLRAVGASRGQVTRSVLVEAFLVGSVASAIGLAVGIGGGYALFAAGDSLPDGPLVVDAATVAVSLGLGIGVTLFAAWLPARRAARIPPVAALAGVHAPASARSLRVRNGIGAVLAVAGGALVIVSTVRADGVLPLGLGVVLLLPGVFVLTPFLSRGVIAVVAPALRRTGVVGGLAGRNAVRNPRRTAATASALTIGLTLVAALTVIGAGADRAAHRLAASDYLTADYIVSMANSGPLAPDTDDILRELPEVTASSPRRVAHATFNGVQREVTAWRMAEYRQLLTLEFTAGGYANGDAAVVDADTATGNGWRVGDTLAVVWPDGAPGTLTLSGIYKGTFDDGVKVDLSLLDPHLDRVSATDVYVRTRGGVTAANERALAHALGDSPAVLVRDKSALLDDVIGQIGIILTVLYGMLALAVVVAVLGIVNTMAMSVHERTREIGLLRAVGLDRAGVRRMVRLESVVISLFGGVLGVGLGVFVGWAVGDVVSTKEGITTWAFVLPWGLLLLCLCGAAGAGVVAAIWPARRAARLDLLAAIRTE
ncbi:ABC transporter [Virgisporangium aliadipatigenens]|uniref:ABC transporter n=1 Tax=Virgisporangium aliadipatigenens TaxID=741659 RepID=A0A8J3YS74_9ACTN|nr:ABC transporter permease [Virgisporangium aliadipatigenens]GIJ48773.1 ABC transporter [Virgisporangium aliadipatigenens]